MSDAGAVAGPTDAPAAEPSAPRLQALIEGRAFEGTVVLLTCLFAAAAYFDAWTYVNTTSGRSLLEPWQDAALTAAGMSIWRCASAPLIRCITPCWQPGPSRT